MAGDLTQQPTNAILNIVEDNPGDTPGSICAGIFKQGGSRINYDLVKWDLLYGNSATKIISTYYNLPYEGLVGIT